MRDQPQAETGAKLLTGQTSERMDAEGRLEHLQQSERRLRAQYAVTRVLAESSTLKDTGQEILAAMAESLGWELGMFWSVDEAATLLRFVDLWHAAQIEASEFIADSRERTFTPGLGLVGRVWASGAPTWIPDVTSDPHFRRAPLAAKVGLHGAFAFPVRKGDRTYGVIEFFSHEIRKPDQEILDMVADLGIKIGQFVERKQIEETLRETERRLQEEARLAEVARVLGDISHDLKNMLMPVVTGAELLQQEITECYTSLPNQEVSQLKSSYELAQELAGVIRRAARRILERVKEISDAVKGLSRPLQVTPCRLSDVVGAVYDTLHVFAGEQSVTLRTEGLDSLPPIKADEGRLFNAIYNLVNNAIPEVPPGGSVTVRGEADTRQDRLKISVIDTGKGMPPEVRESLFTYRTPSRKPGGTGLGTKIIKDVVDAHGGQITVESQEGIGTAFHITLPIGGPP